MTAACVHTLISLKVPDWVFQEIDKRRRGFLWAGKEKANGGQCLVAWPVLGHNSPCLIAPELCKLIRPKTRNTRTVAAMLPGKRWIQDITGMLTAQALYEYILLWEAVEDVQLRHGVEDSIRWKWTPDATYSARSAYQAFFIGSAQFAGARPIWKAWAPLKRPDPKIKDKPYRRHRRGITTDLTCRLCDQEAETADHLLCNCSFTRQVWYAVLLGIGYQNPPPAQGEPHDQKKGLHTTIMLVSWLVWKERNARVFNNGERTPSQLLDDIFAEGGSWIRAGASKLAEIEWPHRLPRSSSVTTS
ncbi:hypothetical protein PVAP13_1NG423319 [Panicum virgatum]|uniref:Reverse transcriptase zinc-binding domain-containing protein n=1 Tax=Panicum virgatum TaxID=38727 RepID=A0A8T0X6W4_PANVG|nr:hypothetical protein PVAP13_1NG423319 [Panicum virgatum]